MQLTAIGVRLEQALAALVSDAAPLGVAVSGGGDSLALLLALCTSATDGPAIHAVTVDHGLRKEAADEARFVANVCTGLGVPHTTLRWSAWDGRGNLQDAARRARYGMIADWAQAQGIGRVALGHTRDDQAETVLMRLARGAGLDGLSAMAAERWDRGVLWLRPFVDIPRADLRTYLQEHRQDWIDDPSNEDTRYDRVRTRAVLAALEPLGITAAGLAATAARLASARAALDACTAEAAARVATEDRGDVLLRMDALSDLPEEIARRLIVAALCWVSSAEYPPRAEALADLLADLGTLPGATLHGCLITRESGRLRIAREPATVMSRRSAVDTLWDGRWQITGPARGDETVAALGESGLGQCPGWRETGLPRRSLLAGPAVWRGETLVAAPLAGRAEGWQARLCTAFTDRLLSH